MAKLFRKLATIAQSMLDGLVWGSVFVFFLWAVGALHYLLYLPNWLRTGLAALYAIAAPISLWRSSNRFRTRAWIAGSVFVIYAATLFIRPSNDRDWDPDHAHVAEATIENGVITINNFRNCRYRSESDYVPIFETKQFPLKSIQSVWLIVQKFTTSESLAHVFLSFGLKSTHNDTPDYFSVSVEIRREPGETYSPLKGLYRNYEVTHVIGDERDLIGVRTVHRPDDRVYMYRINATPQQAQQLLANFVERIQSLRAEPEFYHTLLNNCANGITSLTYELTPEPINWLDSRIVLPGHSGHFAWESGLVGDRANGQTFEQLEAASRIDGRARAAGISESFSNDIRAIHIDQEQANQQSAEPAMPRLESQQQH